MSPCQEVAVPRANIKRSKKPKNASTKKSDLEPPTHQVIGESMSTFFLSSVHASQQDISTVLRNMGHRPVAEHSTSSSSSTTSEESQLEPMDDDKTTTKNGRKVTRKFDQCTYTLRDFAALEALESLLVQYGTASHMGVRDQSYSFFINPTRTGALYYKVLDKIAVIAGDPLCAADQYVNVLTEFKTFCKAHHWGVAIMAASDGMADLAKTQGWIAMRFGVEKVVNPLENPLLLGTGGKRTVTKCKQLLRSGLSIQLYCPAYQHDPDLEGELERIYQEWCTARNTDRGDCQAFMTVFDILSLPRLMAFVYTKSSDGRVNGFAALRKLGQGFHIDPFIASADAPRGTTDLLLFASMALCNSAGVSRLSLGFEPLSELGDITGMSSVMTSITRRVHKRIFGKLPLAGKRTFFERFHPDENQNAGLYIIFLQTPGPRHMLALVHFANIRLRAMMAKNVSKDRHGSPEDLSDSSSRDSSPSVGRDTAGEYVSG